MASPCDIPGLKDTDLCKIAGGVATAIDFASDPLGYIAQKMQEAAAGLAETVLPQLEKLTHPDLSTEWFRSAYEVSFALSIFVMAAFLGWNFLQLGRRRVSGDEVIETLGLYTPMFLGGVMFGPLVGTMLLTLTGAITDSLIRWGVSGSVGGTTKALQDAIAAGDQAEMVGGAIVAIVFFGCLIVALLLAFLVLLVMLVTLYLTGAIIPLSLVWLTHPRQRSKGLKVVMVWVGVCFSHVLLFLLLGVAFRMIGGLATNFDEPGLTVLANLAAATIALLMATLSPLGLLAFAPVGPSTAGGGGPSIDLPSQRSAGGGYAASTGDSQTAQLARDNDSGSDDGAGDPVSTGGGAGGGGGDLGGDADSGGGSAAGGLLGMFAASRGAGSSSSSSMEPVGSGGAAQASAGDDAGADTPSTSAGADSAASSTAGSAQPGADTTSSGLATAGTSAADGTAAMTAGSDRAEQTGDRLTQAGTAAEATGVGAPVGAAMQAAGQGLKAAGAAVSATAGLAQAAGDMATEHMEHGDTHTNGGTGADTRPRR